jgi:hypothetical protein
MILRVETGDIDIFSTGPNLSWEDVEAMNAAADIERLEAIRRGASTVHDREGAEELVDQVEGLLRDVGEGTRIDTVNDDYKRRVRALRAVLRRLGIDHTNPYDDLWRFYESWGSRGLSSYASRRAYAAELYAPVRRALEDLEFQALVDPVGAHLTGWVPVDEHVAKLRARFRIARDARDYNAVGLLCTTTLQVLGRLVFHAATHLPEGEREPGPDDAKRRIGFYVDAVTRGRGRAFAEIRKLVDPTARLAEAVKHAAEPTRVEAGIAADATIQLVNLLRRVSELEDRDADDVAASSA